MIFSQENSDVRGPAIFIDRDGVINRRRPDDYVLDWSQFVFIPGIREALKRLTSVRLPIVVISNQAAVGKALLEVVNLEEITRRMQKELLAEGTIISAAYYCTHRPDEGCSCRKPKPGMLCTAARELNIDLARSIFIGDSKTDIEAAQAAGCRPVLFGKSDLDSDDIVGSTIGLGIAATTENLFKVSLDCLGMGSRAPIRDPS
jgi:histidinol-phosphate phosphatase family protein